MFYYMDYVQKHTDTAIFNFPSFHGRRVQGPWKEEQLLLAASFLYLRCPLWHFGKLTHLAVILLYKIQYQVFANAI